MPKEETPAAPPVETLSLREFWKQGADGLTMSALAAASKVPYSTLYRHLRHKLPLGVKNAKKVEAWSKGRISAAKTLGVEA
jgi:hypothetical protein